MTPLIPFPHIQLFRNLKATVDHLNSDPEVEERLRVPSTVTFGGTVKLRGANFGVVWTPQNPLQAQSREMILTPEADFKGFAKFAQEKDAQIRGIIQQTLDKLDFGVLKVALYGEWVGQGVLKKNKGSAVSKFKEKHWALFGLYVFVEGLDKPLDCSEDLNIPFDPESRIGCVYQVQDPRWILEVNFSDPERTSKALGQAQGLTDEVAAQCPYGKAYGLEGAGEGLVWRPIGHYSGREDLLWKIKSKEHSGTDVKAKKPEVSKDVQDKAASFAAQVVSTNRLEQGLEQPGMSLEKKNTGRFVQWVSRDVERECVLELADVGLTWKQASNAVSTAARTFFFDQIDKGSKA